MRAALAVQAGASCFMAGLIWTMQILNYPLLALVDPRDVPRYEQAHNRRFIWLVGPGVIVALASTAVLLAGRPAGVPLIVPLAALALLAVIIATTIRQGAPGPCAPGRPVRRRGACPPGPHELDPDHCLVRARRAQSDRPGPSVRGE